MSVRIEIDGDACEANGVCVEFVPEALALGDDDVLRLRLSVLPAEAEFEQRAREAARCCPRRALRVIRVEQRSAERVMGADSAPTAYGERRSGAS